LCLFTVRRGYFQRNQELSQQIRALSWIHSFVDNNLSVITVSDGGGLM
jgi:hypothetical protein